MILRALGDSAVVADLDEGRRSRAFERVRRLVGALEEARVAGILDIVAAGSSVAVFYDLGRIARSEASPHEFIGGAVAAAAARAGVESRRIPLRGSGAAAVEIPVCYGGDFGPDLEAVAAHCRLSPEEVVARHCAADYRVQAVGFLPGFPYLAGLPESLETPRRDTPRLGVAQGSVGIGGSQTGIYSLESPGGWQIIGRTPRPLFQPFAEPPALLRAGDAVRFLPVPREAFEKLAAAFRPAGRPGTPPAPRSDRGGIVVRRPGMQTTVQDLGRPGSRAAGVPPGGAMDAFALRAANGLAGNPEGAAGLEITLTGPELEFAEEAVVAVCGAEFEGAPAWKAFTVPAGGWLALGACRRGCRGYLAVAGGIAVDPVLGGRGTYPRGAFGGFEGRALRAGDRLPVGRAAARGSVSGGRLSPAILPAYSGEPTLRVLPGADAEGFAADLLEGEFEVSAHSDRMGIRLAGRAARRRSAGGRASSAVSPGTIQIPPDGRPILLMADAQTIGGYPQAAHVASVDLPLAAQLRPGDRVRFREIALGEAQRLAAGRERDLAILRAGLGL